MASIIATVKKTGPTWWERQKSPLLPYARNCQRLLKIRALPSSAKKPALSLHLPKEETNPFLFSIIISTRNYCGQAHDWGSLFHFVLFCFVFRGLGGWIPSKRSQLSPAIPEPVSLMTSPPLAPTNQISWKRKKDVYSYSWLTDLFALLIVFLLVNDRNKVLSIYSYSWLMGGFLGGEGGTFFHLFLCQGWADLASFHAL